MQRSLTILRDTAPSLDSELARDMRVRSAAQASAALRCGYVRFQQRIHGSQANA